MYYNDIIAVPAAHGIRRVPCKTPTPLRSKACAENPFFNAGRFSGVILGSQ